MMRCIYLLFRLLRDGKVFFLGGGIYQALWGRTSSLEEVKEIMISGRGEYNVEKWNYQYKGCLEEYQVGKGLWKFGGENKVLEMGVGKKIMLYGTIYTP